jgi:pilus assembly protein FimV
MAAATAMVLATGAQAIGFGRVPSSVALGAPLDLAVPLRLQPDESLTSACVSAEVQHGDQRWQGADLWLSLDQGPGPNDRVLRLRTRQVLNEPVIGITLTAGCAAPVTRRFTAFVDPPEFGRSTAVADLAAPTPGLAASLPLAEASASPVAQAAPVAARELSPRVAPARRVRPVAGGPRVATARPATPKPAAAVAAAPAARTTVAVVPRLPAGINRLRLEDEAPEFFPTAASASSGTRPLLPFLADMAAAADAAASASERVKLLEVSLQQIRAESLTQREQINQMRGKVADAESINRLAPWLGAALALMAALALWFGWRLRGLQKLQQAQWWAAAASGEAAASSEAGVPQGEAKPGLPAVAAAPDLPPAPRMPVLPSKTAAKPVVKAPALASEPESVDHTVVLEHDDEPAAESAPQRAVAIEELLDLEQQAEFFVVLGQEEAAIELLTGHIRNTGGSSPLPYLKLLELFRRSGDRESYERTRERFHLRFNAYAAEWDQDLREGQSLEAYPEVLTRLQTVWLNPLDAMAELESLLFRREDGEMFHLPAYRELLFLYSVVRDVFDHQDVRPDAVDVLLPLAHAAAAGEGDGGSFIVTGDRAMVVDGGFERPGATTDLDLDLGLEAPEPPAVVRVDEPGGELSFTLDPPPETPRRR